MDEGFLDGLWARLRQGARNVAGVTFQLAVTADLLVAGRAALSTSPAVVSVVPEGLEDIDCDLVGGHRLLIQTKERGPGGQPIGIADVANVIAHAAEALTGDGQAVDPDASFALVTDGILAAGMVETGWQFSLPDVLKGQVGGAETLRSLTDAVAERLWDAGLPDHLAGRLVEITSVVRQPWHLAARTEATLRDHVVSTPAVAWLAYGRLVVDLAHIAAEQRSRGRQDSHRRTVGDLDALVMSVQETVDVDGLDAALRSGVVRPVDYTQSSSLDRSAFFSGVDVTAAHIAAGLDVIRVEELAAVVDGLSASGQVVIAGPSGSGKSALMWRAGRDVVRGARTLQLLRCSSDDDVTVLVRHVRQQQPTPELPILLCADDLGRDALTHWTTARDQLLGIPGVILLAAVRREDFTARLAGSSTVVDPQLTVSSAAEIYRQIAASGPPVRLENEEAIDRADGLLMEFISLITTGQRIRTVLQSQVEALMQPARRLQRICLRIVTAAHSMGSGINADQLGAYLVAQQANLTMDDVGAALDVLRDEHLLLPSPDGYWRGLHDLRAEVLVELLHAAPPPTLAATYAEVLPLLPPARRGDAIRRAAERLCRNVLTETADPAQALASCTTAMGPVADTVGQLLATLPPSADSAVQATDLLEGSVRADAAAYAAAILPALRAQPGNIDLNHLGFLAYAIRNSGIQMPMLPRLVSQAAGLPPDMGPFHQRVGSHIGAHLASLATACALPAAAALLEAAEPAITMPPETGAHIWSWHVSTLASPPGDGFDIAAADQRARLAASLIALCRASGQNVAAILGPVHERATDAAATEPYALTIELHVTAHDVADDSHSDLIRSETYAPGEILICHVRKLTDPTSYRRRTAYPIAKPQMKGDGAVNDQAVHLARRLFDIAPELDRVDVLAADLQPARIGTHDVGVKRLRHGVIQRATQTRSAVAFQAALARLLAAGSWSERLRQQAQVAVELMSLLKELPLRLRSHDTVGRRRDFQARCISAQTATTALPLRPHDDSSVGTWTGWVDHQAQDEQGRTKDRARDALSQLADVLRQIADGLREANHFAVRGAGFRLGELPSNLAAARQDGAPTYSRIGNTLPNELDDLCDLVRDLLLSLEHMPRLQTVLDKGDINAPMDLARNVVREAAATQTERDRETVEAWLDSIGIPAELHVVVDHERPPGAISRHQILAAAPLDRWPDIVYAIQHWPSETRQNLVGAVVVAPVEQHRLLPMALRLLGSSDAAYPVTDMAVLDQASAAVQLPVVGTTSTVDDIGEVLESLVTSSQDVVRDSRRTATWAQPPRLTEDPAAIAQRLAQRGGDPAVAHGQEENPAAATISILVQLCRQVASEDGTGPGLAASLARVDWANLTESSTDPYIAAINAVIALGLYAKPAMAPTEPEQSSSTK